ncbi:DUF3231 family protein [Virgibacillus xinjiangensis]|uniref:DUF3231 family protein n=1 Tax=Virgibacillus xinjiangensis TaxID=393090 RepID=A0ABV7CU73_9BACI
MENEYHVRLSSAEIANLWTTYQGDTMSICVFNYFLKHVDDEEVKQLMAHALDVSQQHVEMIRKIMKVEEIHIPQGFGEQDVNLGAGRLFTDVFYLHYMKQMAKGGLETYSRLLPDIYRKDIRSFFSKCLATTIELHEKVTKLMLDKGIAVRPPHIPEPKKVEFVEKQSFMLEGLGKGRPLTGLEISNLYKNVKTNELGSALATGFSQVVESKKLAKYILRGKEIATKHVRIFSDYLGNDSLPVPTSIDETVTDSTEAPFSDKLISYHFNLMTYSGIGNYGSAIAQSQRSDLAIDYSRLMAEILKYGEDGLNIMINNGWLEKPPMAAERKS